MKPTVWIDRVAEKHGGCSDYRVAQILGISKQAISKYRNGVSGALDDEVAFKVEIELGLPHGTVMTDQRAEREKNPEVAAVWRRLGKLAAGAAHAGVAGAALTICLSGAAGKAEANQIVTTTSQSAANIHYAQWIRRVLRGLKSLTRLPVRYQYWKFSHGF